MAASSAWSREHIFVLLDQYREEICLYAVKSANYHNKHLRNDALGRVATAVSRKRPGVTTKDCLTKIHLLRNQFNVENNRRKASLNKSGNGADDIYKPSLSYFNYMLFLDEHYIPRKSKSSKIGQPSTRSTLSSEETIDDPSYMNEGFDDGGILRVYTQSPWEDTQHSDFTDVSDFTLLSLCIISTPQPSSVPSTPQPSPVPSTPQPSPVPSTSQPSPVPSTSQPSPVPSTSQPSPVPSTSRSTPVLPRAQSAPPPQQNLTADARPSRSRPPRENQDIPPSKRRKHISHDAAFTGALESIVQTLKVPAMPPPSTNKSMDPADTCGEFSASILKTFKNERLKIDVMSTLVQTLLNAKAQDVD